MGVQGLAGRLWGPVELLGFTLSAKVALSERAGSLLSLITSLAAGWAGLPG